MFYTAELIMRIPYNGVVAASALIGLRLHYADKAQGASVSRLPIKG